MLGLMQDRPLLISSLIEFAALNHGDEEIVSRTVEGPIHRYTYKDCAIRSRRLAKALDKLGVEQSDRIGTLAWNGYRHVEIYYGVSGMGAICHTINPRLFPEQIVYIINHAEDEYIFMDLTFVPLIEAIAEKISNVNGFLPSTSKMRPSAAWVLQRRPSSPCHTPSGMSDRFCWPSEKRAPPSQKTR